MPRKAVRPAKPVPATKDAILDIFKDYPAIDLVSRRFNNPDDPGSLPILLKGEDRNCCVNSGHQNKLKPAATICPLCKKPARYWYVRFTNTSIEGRWSTMVTKAYLPVEIADLLDEQDVADLVKSTSDKYVRRGDAGKEILMKIPLGIYNEIKRLQGAKRRAEARDFKKIRSALAETAGRELGDEAGQTIHDGGIQIESMKTSKSTLSEELETMVD